MDGTESVRSERSTRSQGSSYYHPPSVSHWQPPPPPTQPNDAPPPAPSSSSHPYPRRHPSSASNRPHSRQGSSRDRDRDRDRDRERDRGGGDGGDPYMSRGHHSGHESDMDNQRSREERIEVQVIPQDDNWGETTTAVTGNTSETGFSMENMPKFPTYDSDSAPEGFTCVHHLGTAVAVILSLFGFLSPIIMVILPRLNIIDWSRGPSGAADASCAPECEGLLISFSFKLLILLLGTLALFFRRPKATMPRMFVFRAVVLFLVFVITFAFWLFYGVRIVQEKRTDYHGIVQFADSLVDGLLFIHYLALVLLEVRQLQPQFVVTVTRSPDGESNCYSLGVLTIQRAAVTVLEHYYRDFPAYNPYLDMIGRRPSGKQSMTGFKVYDVDGTDNNQSVTQSRSRAMFAAAARRRDSGHNDRFYDELEYERRVRKRRARLLVAAEEAFTHIKRLQEEQGVSLPMDPQEAAQAVFPSMARALQKYLRITRQQPRHTMESVLAHLATCISHDLSPKAFIARYLTQGAVILARDGMREGCNKVPARWVMVCEQNVIRELEDGLHFQLRCATGEVSLFCQVKKLPHFSLTEDVRDPKSNRFVLRLNSETSV